LYELGNALGGVEILDVDTGKVHRLAVFDDKLSHELKWSPDGRGIFVNYSPKGPNFARGQIGFLRSTGEGFQPITRDTNDYATLTVTADGRTLATVQTKTTHSVYLLPGTGSQLAQLSPLPSQVRDIHWLNWTADGNLLASDGARLWSMKPDGKSPTQLLADSNADISRMSVCGERYLIFEWRFHNGTNSQPIWRVNADGSSAMRLTSGEGDIGPLCSPDQKWVYYYNWRARQERRVSLDGSGKPEVVPGGTNFRGSTVAGGDISPDGKTLAFVVGLTEAGPLQPFKLAIALLNLESPTSPQLLDANRHISGWVQFTPDGKAVAYPIRENEVDNLWVQPLDGSAGHQITNFASDQIDAFHWSPGAKSLGLVRSHSESDVVLLQESKP